MMFVEKGKEGIRKILTECLALLFVLTDRRVPWYAMIVVLVPLGIYRFTARSDPYKRDPPPQHPHDQIAADDGTTPFKSVQFHAAFARQIITSSPCFPV